MNFKFLVEYIWKFIFFYFYVKNNGTCRLTLTLTLTLKALIALTIASYNTSYGGVYFSSIQGQWR